jgi:hypothetical protein
VLAVHDADRDGALSAAEFRAFLSALMAAAGYELADVLGDLLVLAQSKVRARVHNRACVCAVITRRPRNVCCALPRALPPPHLRAGGQQEAATGAGQRAAGAGAAAALVSRAVTVAGLQPSVGVRHEVV